MSLEVFNDLKVGGTAIVGSLGGLVLGTVGELSAISNGATGEYLKGNTGAIPSWATLNQAAVAGLTTGSNPTFAGLTIISPTYPVATFRRNVSGNTGGWGVIDMLSTTTSDMVDGFGTAFTFSVQDDTAGPFILGSFGAQRDGADNTGKIVIRAYLTGNPVEVIHILSSGKVGIGTTSPNESLEVSGKIRALTAFNLNGTDGVTQAAAAGTIADPTAIAGGIVTAQTQVTYIADGSHSLVGITSITTANGRITAMA